MERRRPVIAFLVPSPFEIPRLILRALCQFSSVLQPRESDTTQSKFSPRDQTAQLGLKAEWPSAIPVSTLNMWDQSIP